MNIIILGADIISSHIAEILCARDYNVTIVDSDSKKISKIESKVDVRSVVGDILSYKTLNLAGCKNADLLISVTDDDTANITACMLAKHLGTQKVIAKIKDKALLDGWYESYTHIFKIDLVLVPEQLAAYEIAKRIGTAGFFVPHSLKHSNIAIQEWTISSKSPYINIPLKNITDFQNINLSVIFRENEILIPSGDDFLMPKDRFCMVGGIDAIHELSIKLMSEKSPKRTVLIYGGNDIGFTLAKLLENTKLSVKLVESDENVCKFLSQNLNKTLIFHSTCLEEQFLLQENIQDVDLFVAVTNDEEDNLIASLMAKELGAKETIVLSDRQEYGEIMQRLGVDMTISPRLITANELLHLLSLGPIKPLMILQENIAEVIEIQVSKSSKLIDVPIMNSNFPKGMIIAALIREQNVIVPKGDVEFKENDIAIIFTLNENLNLIQKTF